MGSDDTRGLGYRRSLDGLRGVAVLMVMAYHAPFPLVAGGFLGVDVFFVLSGFLITALLLEEQARAGRVNLGHFYARRALRLLPALAALLSVVVAARGFFLAPGTSLSAVLLSVLFYAANWVMAYGVVDLATLSPTWSLAIEEQFYLLWPPLLAALLALRVRRSWIVLLLLAGVAAPSVIRAALWDAWGPAVARRLYYGLDTRMDSLLLGCLVGVLAAWEMLPRRGWPLVLARYGGLAAAAVLGVLAFTAPGQESVELSHGVGLLACVAVAVLIVMLVTSPHPLVAAGLENGALVWIGRVSYGLYLWHVPVFHGLLTKERVAALPVRLPLRPLRFVAAIAVAGLSYHVLERPMLRLKDRFRGNAARQGSHADAGRGRSARA